MNTIQSNNAKRGIAFLKTTTLELYEPSILRVVSTQIPNDVICDMEIINQDSLNNLIRNLLSAHKFPPTEFFFILASPVFTKEFQALKEADMQTGIDKFLEYVPFETVISKQIPQPKGVLVVAGNGSMYEGFQKAFLAAGSSLGCITPLLCLDPNIQKETSLTPQIASRLLAETAFLRKNAFGLPTQKSNLEYEPVLQPEKPKPKSTLPLLIPLFVVLVVILILVIIQSQKQPSTPLNQPKSQPTTTKTLLR